MDAAFSAGAAVGIQQIAAAHRADAAERDPIRIHSRADHQIAVASGKIKEILPVSFFKEDPGQPDRQKPRLFGNGFVDLVAVFTDAGADPGDQILRSGSVA